MNSLLSAPDYLVILIYNALLIGIGIVLAKRKVKNASDFTTASQSLGTFTIAGSIISTCMGASILFSNYQLVHQNGLKGLVSGAFWYGGWVILILLVRKMRSTGAISIPDFISKRYGKKAQKIAAWAVIIMGISSCAAQFKSIGAMTQSLGICTPTMGIILGAVVIILFTFFSGMWGSAVTNAIQSIFILIVCAVIVPLTAAHAAGGLSNAMANVDPEQLSLEGSAMSTSLLISYMVSSTLQVAVHPSYSKYSLSGKDTKSAVLGQTIAWIACTIVWIVAVIPALWIGEIFPDMTDGSLFVPRLVATFMPVGIRGLVIAGVLSLLITTGNTFLLLLTSSITDDVIRPMNPNIEDKKLLVLNRVIIVVGAVLIASLAIAVPDIVTAFKIGANASGPVVGIPVLIGFFWKKANNKAITATMIAACITSIGLDIVFVATGGDPVGNLYACALSLIGCIFGSIYMNAKEKKTVAA